jgi:hypothetical protein
MTMSIGRLLDPVGKGTRQNLSLDRLTQEVRPHVDPATAQRFQIKLDNAKVKCASIEVWRNKRVGHNDRNAALQPKSGLLPSITVPVVDAALAAIAEFLNDVRHHFTGAMVAYTPVLMRGSGKDLVFILDLGIRVSEQHGHRFAGIPDTTRGT